ASTGALDRVEARDLTVAADPHDHLDALRGVDRDAARAGWADAADGDPRAGAAPEGRLDLLAHDRRKIPRGEQREDGGFGHPRPAVFRRKGPDLEPARRLAALEATGLGSERRGRREARPDDDLEPGLPQAKKPALFGSLDRRLQPLGRQPSF